MADELEGVLLVRDHTGDVGIVSQRDPVRGLADGVDPEDDRVRQVMTDQVATVDVDVPALAALERMVANEIRHLVVTRRGRSVA